MHTMDHARGTQAQRPYRWHASAEGCDRADTRGAADTQLDTPGAPQTRALRDVRGPRDPETAPPRPARAPARLLVAVGLCGWHGGRCKHADVMHRCGSFDASSTGTGLLALRRHSGTHGHARSNLREVQ